MKNRDILFGLVFVVLMSFCAIKAATYSNYEMTYAGMACDKSNLDNTLSIEASNFFIGLMGEHHFIGPVVTNYFYSKYHLVNVREAKKEINQIPEFIKYAKIEKKYANSYALILVALGLIYLLITYVIHRQLKGKEFILALTTVSMEFFAVGITAPAMVVLTAVPKNPTFPSFVLSYQTRSVLGVIKSLFTSEHWMVAICLVAFSLVIPLVKSIMTAYSVKTGSNEVKNRIYNILSLIGKWSMADVFVGAIILANFALAADKATQVILVLGFYFFLGYCILSLITTTLLRDAMKAHQESDLVG